MTGADHSHPMAGAIDAAAAGIEAAGIALLERLIVAGKDGPDAVDALVAARMRELGCEVEEIVYDPSRVPMVDEFATQAVAVAGMARCLVGRVAGQDARAASARSLLLFAHPDTEPHRPLPQWQGDPFVPTIRDGRLFGWGVADDLAGIAVMLQSLAVLREAGLSPASDLTLISAPSKRHARGIGAALHGGVGADAAIYLHPAESGRGLGEIKAFAPGQLEFRITVTGMAPDTREPAHTAFAHRGVNPLLLATRVIAALETYDDERAARVNHPRLQAAIGRSTNLMLTRCSYGDAAAPTRIAPDCTLGGAVSLVPGERLETVIAEIEAVIGNLAAADEWLAAHPPRIEWIAGVSAAETPDDADIHRLVSAEIARAGTEPAVNPLHTSSDIRNPIIQKNIPTVGYGPLCGGLAMSGLADEWVDVADFVRTIRVTAHIVAAWCGVDTASATSSAKQTSTATSERP